jgi:sugar (pentulose or hexulose) kinase
VILSIDLGTSATKAALWDDHGLAGAGISRLATLFGETGRVEQDAAQWWASTVSAVGAALAVVAAPNVQAIGLAGARQTFVPVDERCEPIGRAFLWNDRRAGAEAEAIVAGCGGTGALRDRTGIYYEAGAVAAKIAWLARHEPARLARAQWLLAPKDLVGQRLTGVVATDETLASAAGLLTREGGWAADLLEVALDVATRLAGEDAPAAEMADRFGASLLGLLPGVCAPATVLGGLAERAAKELGLPAGIPVVAGAGDRQCEVLGAGATPEAPMVSWGTTANVSIPREDVPVEANEGLVRTRAAGGGWLLEGGLAAAGSLLEWVASLTGHDESELLAKAREVPAGAGGISVLPWLGGARAPWWCARAGLSIHGLQPEHDAAALARAAVEGIAYDIDRCLSAAYSPSLSRPERLCLAGAGSKTDAWVGVLTGVTGVPAVRRRSGRAAALGAAMLAATAIGCPLDLERVDPIVETIEPDERDVARYRALRPPADRLAETAIEAARDEPA